LQGRSQDPSGKDFRHTFHVIKVFFVTPRFLSLGSDGSECRQVVVHPPRGDVWGSLRSLRTTLAKTTERLSRRSAEVADLRLLCVDLGAEAATAPQRRSWSSARSLVSGINPETGPLRLKVGLWPLEAS
jgi:hypothetical protein